MERNAKFIISLAIFALAAVAVGGYSYVRFREFLNGPSITITEPVDGSSLSESAVIVAGEAKNVAYISLNDSQIFVDSNGRFVEKLLLLPGYNILTLRAQDRFGKKVEKTLEVVYTEASKEEIASTTSPIN